MSSPMGTEEVWHIYLPFKSRGSVLSTTANESIKSYFQNDVGMRQSLLTLLGRDMQNLGQTLPHLCNYRPKLIKYIP